MDVRYVWRGADIADTGAAAVAHAAVGMLPFVWPHEKPDTADGFQCPSGIFTLLAGRRKIAC